MTPSTAPRRGDTHHEPPPADAAELARFPARTVDGIWYRAHVDRTGPDHGCWWFSSAGAPAAAFGRFDLPAPRGTCYLASTAEAAARERVGTQLRRHGGRMSVLETVLATVDGPVVVTEADVGTVRSANLPVKAAGKFINRSLWAGTGIYTITQAWAAAFDEAGFAGICYPPRFTLGARVRALALFGPGGSPSPGRAVGDSVPLRHVLEGAGVVVVAVPYTAASVTLPATAAPPAL